MVLIIDDRQWRHDAIVLKAMLRKSDVRHAYGYWEAVDELNRWRGALDRIYLDYNLGNDEFTGLDVANYMVLKGLRIPVTVISTNIFGALETRKFLRSRGYEADWIPAILFL